MLKNNSILELKNIRKIYHDLNGETLALDNISFNVYEKEFVTLIGPSGCGKSTILSILAGLDKNYHGKVISKENLKIGYMLQTDSLFSWRTIFENCLIGLEINNQLTEENINYVNFLLKKYDLYQFKDKYPENLSGGMRQRVALIRTLSLKPDLLLLDEPLSALDSQSRLAIGADIFNIIKTEGKTAIMVTHDLPEALSVSDRIVVLTKRPARVKNIYNVEFKNLDFHSRKMNPNFNKLHDKIWRDLDVNIT